MTLDEIYLDWDNDAGVAILRFASDNPAENEWAELKSAVILSLFCDAAAAPDDQVPAGDVDPRGWWADGDIKLGSHIWLHINGPRNQATLDQLRQDCLNALQWLIDDGVAQSVDVAMAWKGVLAAASITITRNGESRRFDFAWI